jgi:nucleotide-binding universal stress UspA family protein
MAAKHILACIDFSPQSTRALRETAEYARVNGSKVTLLHVRDPRSFVPPEAILEPAPREEKGKCEAELAELRDEHLSGIDVDLAVIEDHAAARAICDYAEEHDVDLIVVGSHGRGAMERWLIGTVAERVVRHAKVNVYVVRR